MKPKKFIQTTYNNGVVTKLHNRRLEIIKHDDVEDAFKLHLVRLGDKETFDAFRSNDVCYVQSRPHSNHVVVTTQLIMTKEALQAFFLSIPKVFDL
jgi:hypothetical protein